MNMPTWHMPLSICPMIGLVGTAMHPSNLIHRCILGPNAWHLHIVRYHGRIHINGMIVPFHPGCATVLPPNSVVDWEFGNRPVHLVCHFSLVGAPDCRMHRFAAVRDLGDEFLRYNEHFERVIARHQINPTWAEATLWDLLFDLSEPSPPPVDVIDFHPAVQRTILHIESAMAAPVSARDLADISAVSPTHLNRLFRKAMGISSVEFLRRKRVERARELLERSNLPIATVAVQVGIPDPHQFNKLIRRSLGMSPRQVRANAHSGNASGEMDD